MSQKESGFIKPIIIGVVTTVMGAVVVSQFDLIKSGTGSGEANTESELTRRQTELEEKIQQLSEQNQPDKSQKNDDMDWGSSFYNLEEEESSYPQAEPNVSGSWTFTNLIGTYTFVLRQSGNAITLQEFDAMGNLVGNGEGTIHGHSVNLSWVEPYMYVMTVQVQAYLDLSRDGQRLTGQMVMQGSSIALTFFKQ